MPDAASAVTAGMIVNILNTMMTVRSRLMVFLIYFIFCPLSAKYTYRFNQVFSTNF